MADNVIPLPYTPAPERLAEIYAAADAAWPERERELEEREAEEALKGKMRLLPKRGLRAVPPA
jgi:hypothetical protein